jgi:hypothetical protein
MIRNLVSSTPKTAVDKIGIEAYQQYGGFLVQPRSWSSPQKAVDCGSVWAMDNGCFKAYDPDAILTMLKKSQGISGCLFAVVPDVVCDAAATLILFNAWISTYQRYGYPPCLVAQNGIENTRIPWDSMAALFIGGDNAFKYSNLTRELVTEAKQRGKWVHMGRVNSWRRIQYAIEIGCDSFDGTGHALYPENIRKHLPFQQMKIPKLAL